MKKTLRVVVLLLCGSSVFAQVDTNKLVVGWNHGISTSLNLNQVAFSDWATGGDDAISYNATIIGKSIDNQEMTSWTNNYKFGYGQANLANKGLRKTDDIIDLESIFAYKLSVYINPYAGVTFKTSFTDGYEYAEDGTRTAISTFVDPAYSRQAIGIGLIPIPELKTRVGLALRETFTSKYNKWADDPSTPEIEKTRIEGGVEWVTETTLKLDDNLFYTSKVEAFAAFKTFDKWVIYNDNVITAKVSKLISAVFSVTIRYEEFVIARTQIREGLSLGISYQIL
jgi:hypothetical protein